MSNTAPASVLSPLLMEHTHADREAAALRSAVRNGDRPAVRACVSALRRALLQHFDAEEAELFVFYRQRESDEVSRLEQEHADLRAALATAEENATRGTFGLEEMYALTRALTLHEAHEELGIYRWAKHKAER